MDFQEYWDRTRRDINDILNEIFVSEPDDVLKFPKHALKAGKRFRPTLTVLICDALGGNRKQALLYGSVIELIHNSSLIHDDIQDEDLSRRGDESVWAKFGIKHALFLGDGLLAKAYSLIKSGEAAKVVGEGVWALFKGFAKEISSPREAMSYAKYLDIVMLKTAALYATATALGAIASKESIIKGKSIARKAKYKRLYEAARNYGKYVGIIHQLCDDIHDNELPFKLTREQALKDVDLWIARAVKQVRKFPRNKYRDIMLEVPTFVRDKILTEEV